jgi:uncharacterized protein YutE (UPF0331/DUF86 family)
MDEIVVQQKLESLRRCTLRIQEKLPATLGALAADVDMQDVLVLNLSRAVQICVDLAMHRISTGSSTVPQTMGQAFDILAQQKVISETLSIRMRKAVGFRNIAVHSYENIDWSVVYSIAKGHLNDFREYAEAFR